MGGGQVRELAGDDRLGDDATRRSGELGGSLRFGLGLRLGFASASAKETVRTAIDVPQPVCGLRLEVSTSAKT